MALHLPRLYAIVDPQLLSSNQNLFDYSRELISAGVTLIQFRDKRGSSRQTLSDARELARIARSMNPDVTLVMNDRADLAVAAGFNGVHLGQDDLSPHAVRKVCPVPMAIGVSTHNPEQITAADSTDADYLAIGPAFATSSKQNPDPVVGIEGVRQARSMTKKPLVAIGGITPDNARQVIDAGADSIAIITALTRETRKSVEAFLSVLG